MTLSDLKRKVTRHIEGAYVEPEDLLDAINTARRDVWRAIGGPLSDTLALDLVAGQRDYPLEPIAPVHAVLSVSARAGTADANRPRRLTRCTPRDLYRGVSSYPNTEGPTGAPSAWTLRPIASGPWGVGPGVSLYPTPDVSVAGGLILEVAGAAADLVNDTDFSPLTPEADEAACWLAAANLALDNYDDPTLQRKAGHLTAKAEQATDRATWALFDMDGGVSEIIPQDGFGLPGGFHIVTTPTNGRAEPPTEVVPVGPRRRVSATVGTVAGESSVVVDLPPMQPIAPDGITGAMAFSDDQGFIRGVAAAGDRKSLTVTLRPGFTFFGEPVTVFYETVGS